ncbi:MAG: ribonuclease H-like domain-containing protein [Candidatus Moranbacteria bacterium]|nr:ribonuclease H-like domain-containing protein [Candidatus Moranbacteria bacterium]
MRKIVLDIETRNTFQEVGSNDPTKLDISLLVIYDYKDKKYSTFTEENFADLWKILEDTDLIIGYNSDYFDIPLLNKYYSGDLLAVGSLDLLTEIRKSLGKAVRLDNIAEATLGVGKSGHGLQAIEWWKAGEIKKIEKYCQQDVKVTKDLYEYAIKNKKMKYKDLLNTVTFDVTTDKWDSGGDVSINYTLPL